MRRRSLALALSLLLPGVAFAQAQPQTAPASSPAPRTGATVVLTSAPSDWRRLEGQRVRIAAPLTLAGSDGLERFGELVVAFDGRLWQPTEVAAPGTAGIAQVMADNARRRLVLDDGSDARDPGPVAYLPEGADLRVGLPLRNVEGIVRIDAQGQVKLQVEGVLEVPMLKRASTPPAVAGRLHVAAFNLENFFNGDGQGGGFPTLRGARTLEQHKAQVAKLVATINALGTDVAALMELENDGYGPQSAIAELVNALNADIGAGGDWRFVDAGKGPGDNPIRVGIIYRQGRLTPVGAPVTLEGGPFVEHSRVPLAQAFRAATGEPFMVVANHFKSKGCRDASGADADQNDGQGCWNATRVDSAKRLNQWVKAEAGRLKVKDIVLLGDFNAYAMEDPIRTLRGLGWQDAFAVARVERPYSYVYNGYTGRLDHALLSAGMARRLGGAAEWHINADEPESAGYQQRNMPGPWRSSDHDPLLLGFDK
ncbi:ExeM/NucH family extracellular endonuclease [Stenotrophomonas sp. 24(2023)]|uniref:ExeM/NucH family extracellular endonuclease n=1 Tax=Stenotrophomonas sp. 24(2023) TaxID=3068324 RepID=UPI0027DF8BE0|nr:ExeM/NucH family extracellular endonuclease [Stenotrophomonas sp. 24(2023)]WMJ71281.1 ExeM/NucH family extracellular endonuclease [Stenotrophomonas sp. 24(2023)]